MASVTTPATIEKNKFCPVEKTASCSFRFVVVYVNLEVSSHMFK